MAMTFMRRLSAGAAIGVIAMVAAPAVVQAQVITGAIQGRLTDEAGAPVAGAQVTIVHAPSGTTTTATTSADGAFSARNLRPGGPYRVTATSETYGAKTVEVPAVNTGDAFQLNFALDGGSVDAVVVTAASVGAKDLKTGPSSNFSAAQIQLAPSISRDLKDLARMNPFVAIDSTNSKALICGGANNRSNSLTIDGVRQNDDFGLQANGYPTQRSPVSMDVVETLGVELAPYDVNYGSFGGCTMNATTKSGGNAFHGMVFFENTNQNLQGKKFEYDDFQDGSRQKRTLGGKFSEKTWGATLTGPIIKDRLFFTANYEKFERVEPSLTGPVGSGMPNEVPGITVAQAEQVREIIKRVYGYDPLGYSASQFRNLDEKYFIKLDWNISERHRATVSYQRTYGSNLNASGNTLTGASTSLGLLSKWIERENNLDVYKAQLFSNWTDNFTTELSASYKKMDNPSTPLAGTDYAQFRVFVNGTGAGPSIYAGTDASYQANELTTYLQQYRAKGVYTLGAHKITGGYEREALKIWDVFVQNANGAYVFDSIADLEARRASSLAYANAGDNIKAHGGATIHSAMNTVYLQDEWAILPNLTLKAGLRYDWFEQSDSPQANPVILARYGLDNSANLDGKHLLQPRFGFNWQPDPTLTVYGGVGLFGGGSPTVWTANTFYNTGIVLGNVNCARTGAASAACLAGLNNVDAKAVNPAVQQLNTASAATGQGLTNILDPDFKPQSSWKASIGVQKYFDLGRFGGDDWRVSAEYIRTEVKDAVTWRDLYSEANPGPAAPDGRPTFLRGRDNRYDILVTNTGQGHTDQLGLALGKRWSDGWLDGLDAQLSHTYINSKDVNPGISTVAAANYNGVATDDPNDPGLATSNYEFRNLSKLSLSYRREFFAGYRTGVSLFAQRRSGLPFSYTFDVGANAAQAGDVLVGENGSNASRNRQLLYVPKTQGGLVTANSDPIITYAPGFDFAAFNAFLQKTGLIDYAGKITPRNAFKSPEVTTIDVRLSQEAPAFFPHAAKAEIYVDIENLGNMLNNKWGVIQQVPNPYVSSNIVARNCQFAGIGCAAGQGNFYQFDKFTSKAATSFNTQSVWQVKLGVRYKF
ncbi:TonB-dependent receptor [Caulobacter vibrioides]|nr:TonB-dependent receptor [Caulobacter vibrioides]